MTPRPIRIPGQRPEAWTEATQAEFNALTPAPDGSRPLHLPSVVAYHPTLLAPYLHWAKAIALLGVLTERDHALLALRTAWLCRSAFEWGTHAQRARHHAGLRDDELQRVAEGPDADGWSPHEAALLRAADDLHSQYAISESTWNSLVEHCGNAALLEIVFVVGHTTMLAMVTNTAGVPGEDHWMPLPLVE